MSRLSYQVFREAGIYEKPTFSCWLDKQIRWALQLREKHIDLLKRSYEESCCNDELLWLIFFVAKLTDASSFINAEMSDSSILGFYSNLYRSKNIN